MSLWMKRAATACLLGLCVSGTTEAQSLPSEPVVLGDGLLTLGANLSATFGPRDSGFFNYTDYEDSTLRMLRIDATASLRAGRHVSLLGEVRSQNVDRPEAYALYARVRPWAARRFDIQVGRIPPTFGAFSRRTYEADNPLIGYPLAYQYLTSLRADALPADADELLQMRGRGWLAAYSLGSAEPAPGVALASAFRWDTGVQAHAANDFLEVTGSLTTGTLSNPRVRDDNSGRQVAARVELHPYAGLVLGVSGARGPFVSRAAARAAAVSDDADAPSFAQTAWGSDVEYSVGYYLVRAEAVFSQWRIPTVGEPLTSLATSIEARYKIRPGFYVAGRFDHLGFGEIAGREGHASWDAPVSRVEAGGGYSIQRNLLLKISAQHDRRDGGRTRTASLLAGQLVYWF
jgi:hypothetical protein